MFLKNIKYKDEKKAKEFINKVAAAKGEKLTKEEVYNSAAK